MNPSRYVLFRSQIAPMIAPPISSGFLFPGPGPYCTFVLLSDLGSAATLPSENQSAPQMWRRREEAGERCGRSALLVGGDTRRERPVTVHLQPGWSEHAGSADMPCPPSSVTQAPEPQTVARSLPGDRGSLLLRFCHLSDVNSVFVAHDARVP